MTISLWFLSSTHLLPWRLLILNVTRLHMAHELIFADPQLRHMRGHRHGHLKSVKIGGFSSTKSLVELTCYILSSAVSLECLTLDTIYGPRCDQGKDKRCFPMSDGALMEAPRGRASEHTLRIEFHLQLI